VIRRIILHAGTPKTGTTSLQLYLAAERELLLQHGILYPRFGTTGDQFKPKHQWLVESLHSRFGGELHRKITEAVREADVSTHTLVLSSEGLFHHWQDFSTAGRRALAALARDFHVEIWVWFRDPISFVQSNYIQMLRNPLSRNVFCYGKDLSPEEMLKDPWFARQLDYMGFVSDAEQVVGNGAVRPFSYTGDTIRAFCDALGIAGAQRPISRSNPAFGALAVELLRILNRRDLGRDKERAVKIIATLDAARTERQPFTISPAVTRTIQDICLPGLRVLEAKFGLYLHASQNSDGLIGQFESYQEHTEPLS